MKTLWIDIFRIDFNQLDPVPENYAGSTSSGTRRAPGYRNSGNKRHFSRDETARGSLTVEFHITGLRLFIGKIGRPNNVELYKMKQNRPGTGYF
jgi:hypothetical protein